jgi:ABC-type xylose transport system permease subunit
MMGSMSDTSIFCTLHGMPAAEGMTVFVAGHSCVLPFSADMSLSA